MPCTSSSSVASVVVDLDQVRQGVVPFVAECRLFSHHSPAGQAPSASTIASIFGSSTRSNLRCRIQSMAR